jgi:ATP-binding cassette, subfamily B, bacterial
VAGQSGTREGKEERAGRPADSVRDRWRCFPRLLRLLFTLSPGAMAVNAGVTLLLGLTPLLSLAVLRRMVDAAVRAGGTGAGLVEALGWAGALVATRALQGMGETLGSVVRDQIQEQLKVRIQERVTVKAQSLPLAAFEQKEFYDRLQQIERGLDNRLLSTMGFTFHMGNHVVTLAALLVYVGAAHWSLPVILAGGTLPFLLMQIRLPREDYLLERRQTERRRRLGYLAELMTAREAATEIRLFGLRDHLLEAWSRMHGGLREERLRLIHRRIRFVGTGSSGRSLTFGLALTMVVYRIARGALTVGQYAAFVGAMQQLQQEMRDLLWGIAVVDNDLRYIRDFFLYLDLPEEEPGTAHLPAGRLLQGIRFERVRFAYPGSERLALDGIDLWIRPGERIALVGENGAGKTTLARLLLGLYAPTEGRILIDGVDLAQLDPTAWRRRAAAVFQDFQQYHLSVRENIAFGQLERTDERIAIERAARLSGADTVAATLPRGFDTLLGKEFEEGVELSPGQWQKIAVARAYLREAEVLVLDEPTAALDARAEVEVYRQFRDVSAGKTVLLISHRLGSARLADRILVLDGGRVVEEGTHAALMQNGGLYARMLGIQSQWYPCSDSPPSGI